MKRKKGRIGLLVFAVISFLGYAAAYAQDVTWQGNNMAILTSHSILEDAMRAIGFGIIKLFCDLANVCETLFNKTFGMLDLTTYPTINAIINQLKPVLVALTVLCLIGLGIVLMVKKEKKDVVKNVLISILAITCSTYIFATANSLVSSFKEGVLNEDIKTGQSYTVVNNNLIDLVALDKAGNISSLNYEQGVGIKHNAGIVDKKSLAEVDINELLNWSDKEKGQDVYGWSSTFNKYLRYRAVTINGSYVAIENYDGVLGTTFGNEFFYRYDFDFWAAALQVLSLVIIFIALSYKNVRVTYELIVSRIVANVYAADIGNGERLKQVLIFIRDTYIALCISILSVKLFFIITESLDTMQLVGLGKGLVSIFIAMAVIDGPNLSEKLLGIDAGLRSSMARSMAVFGVAKQVAKTAGKLGKAGFNKLSGNGKGKTDNKSVLDNKGDKPAKDVMGGGSASGSSAGKTSGTNRKWNGEIKRAEKDTIGKRIMGENVSTQASGSSAGKTSGTNVMGGGMAIGAAVSVSGGSKANAKEIVGSSSAGVGQSKISGKGDSIMRGGSQSVSAANVSGSGKANTKEIMGSSAPEFGQSKISGKGESVMGGGSASGASVRPERVSNPYFKQMVNELKPPPSSSAGERKDFNAQVNNIVRGDHTAIPPAPGTRAAYKFENYEKAKQLEVAYRKVNQEIPEPVINNKTVENKSKKGKGGMNSGE